MATGLHGCVSDEEYDDMMEGGDDDAWVETEQEPVMPTLCLFCREKFDTPGHVYSHCVQEHSFDIRSVVQQWNMDCFSYIKMVNFIRSQVESPLLSAI